MSVEELASTVHRVIGSARTARQAITYGSDNLGEARDLWAALFAGTSGDCADLAPLSERCRADLARLHDLLTTVEAALQHYLDQLGASSVPAGRSATVPPAPSPPVGTNEPEPTRASPPNPADSAPGTRFSSQTATGEDNDTHATERSTRPRARFGKATTNDYRKTFFEAYPETRGLVWVHHAVERITLKRYPDAKITPEEMHSLENLRGIPKLTNNRLHLSTLRKEWNRFYEEHPDGATKEELLDFATYLDDKYGDEFNPPVR